jgi:hypothetical protein
MDTTPERLLNKLGEHLSDHSAAQRKMRSGFGASVTADVMNASDPERTLTTLFTRLDQSDRARDGFNDAFGPETAERVREVYRDMTGTEDVTTKDSITRTEFEGLSAQQQHDAVQSGVTIND